MTRSRDTDPPRGRGGRSGGDPADLDAAYLNEQLESMRQQLEDYVAARLDGRSGGLPGTGAGYTGGATDGGVKQLWMRWRPEVYLLVVLVLFGFLYLRGGGTAEEAGSPGQELAQEEDGTGNQPEAQSVTPEVESTPAALPEDADAAWRGVVDDHRAELVAWVKAAQGAAGLPADRVTPTQKRNFGIISDELGGGRSLGANQEALLRTGLFEYLYGLWLTRQGDLPADFRVTQQFTGYQASAVRDLLEHLDLDELDLTDDDLTAPPAALRVVILERWIEREEPPAG